MFFLQDVIYESIDMLSNLSIPLEVSKVKCKEGISNTPYTAQSRELSDRLIRSFHLSTQIAVDHKAIINQTHKMD